jgi:hypothetical protein
MWLSFWEDQFLLGEMPALIVRHALRELFTGGAAREYWKQVRANRLATSEGRTLRFLRIVDEEYKRALGTSPAVSLAKAARRSKSMAPGTVNRRFMAVGAISACFAVASTGVLAGQLLRHWWKIRTRHASNDRSARQRS